MSHTKKPSAVDKQRMAQATPLAEVSLPSDADLDGAAELARLVADRTRLAILALLAQRELSVGEIAQKLQRPMASVSQHLAKLRIGRLVSSRRAGTTIYCALANEHVGALVTNILEQSEHTLYDRPPHHEAPHQAG
ncbi:MULTISPECIES: metalloregulator ArsR/SmtB family transcription factor [unclassified Arthrobacter]|uniref:ArsR/SmtB family transcription factor n=1 Tax=unclassified Arthrobacter TaxID=235627 RepID=UPI00288328F9|nr:MULTISPECIES: metalloregulator ArsR/SmtB family transcription factor [unclassified Arthrobacter]